jgi:hydroxysqualene synthase
MRNIQTNSPAGAASLDSAGAFAFCERVVRGHYENFPVGSLLVPKSKRKHVYSLYAFARAADDFADEGDQPDAARLAALDEWEAKLEAAFRGRATHPVFVALGETVRELDLPEPLFRDLLSAFRQDVRKRRYADFDELLDYCRRSANPVGRLILRLFGHRDARLDELSDCICTALQLTNFWQDVAVDIDKDRVYLPADEMARHGVSVDELRARRYSERYAALLAAQIERTRALFARGAELPSRVGGRLAIELRLTWLGGMHILERIEAREYDTLHIRPAITAREKLQLLARALFPRRNTRRGTPA